MLGKIHDWTDPIYGKIYTTAFKSDAYSLLVSFIPLNSGYRHIDMDEFVSRTNNNETCQIQLIVFNRYIYKQDVSQKWEFSVYINQVKQLMPTYLLNDRHLICEAKWCFS